MISFPPPTKMLQFGGFPIASRLFPKKQEVPFSHLRIQDILASPRSLSQLVTTFIGTRAERSPSWVVASHVCYHTMRVTLRYLIHANSASTKDYLLRSSPPQPFPRHGHAKVLSKQPTCPLYMNKSVWKGYLEVQVLLTVAAL